MVSKFTLLGLLLATVALAVPSSLVEAPIARGQEDHQSQPIGRVTSRAADRLNDCWAGAFLGERMVSVSDVQYTFTVPNVRAYDTGISQNVAFALMLGTTGCRSYIYLGVSFEFDHRDKSSKLHAFYATPGGIINLPNRSRGFVVNVGDRIYGRIILCQDNENSASMYLVNQDNVSSWGPVAVNVGKPLLGDAAAWVVMAPKGKLADFGEVTFKDIRGMGFSGEEYHWGYGATKLDIVEEGRRVTTTTFDLNNQTIFISYTR